MCDFHPKIFSRLLKNKDHLHEVGKARVFCGIFGLSKGLSISSLDRGSLWIDDLVLASSKNRIQNLHRGRITDAQYVDINLLRGWRRSCDSQQQGGCQHNAIQDLLHKTPPTYLIDTWLMCLIPGYSNASYVALSYVWGREPFFQTTKANIRDLQVNNALGGSQTEIGLPRTISDAISVVQLLGERYLWVDALCIVQDDNEMKHDQVKDMASIFANASITIMAHQGEDANYGLRGLRGISYPRQISQERFTLENGDGIVQLRRPSTNHSWFQRGWTYQEGLFSRRKLTFNNDAIFWDCPCSSFQEDLEPLTGRQHPRTSYTSSHLRDFTLTSSIPSFSAHTDYVTEYNSRKFTFAEDAMAAFSGIITVASQSFHGGFVCGLPVLFFDVALCWQPANASAKRRHPSKKTNSEQMRLPSWSWVGWHGEMNSWGWNSGCNFVKMSRSLRRSMTSRRTISTVQWYSRRLNSKTLNPILGPEIVQKARNLAHESDYVLSPGWKRFQHFVDKGELPITTRERESWPDLVPPKYFFKHDSDPETEFWYPLPINEKQQGHYLQTEDSILCCHTQKAALHLAEQINTSDLHFSLRKDDKTWAGILQLNVKPRDSSEALKGKSDAPDNTICDLVVISEGYFHEGWQTPAVDEIYIAERPKVADGARYEFYNVLWVEWEEDIAYRKGLGRVVKHLWDSLNPEGFDLVLG